MRNTISGFTILVALAGTTLLTACGSDTAANKDVTETSTIAASPALKTVDSKLGSVVADQSGHTLYAFTKDTNGISTCYDACATTWPPALSSETTLTGTGIDGVIGATERKDGTEQLTLNGMPLYRFAADGDTAGALKGQANKGVWFVLDADGALLKQAVPAAATTTTTTAKKAPASGGYSSNYDYGY
jgi:predicted lipoprotein with Yx(FWY)xxD motif